MAASKYDAQSNAARSAYRSALKSGATKSAAQATAKSVMSSPAEAKSVYSPTKSKPTAKSITSGGGGSSNPITTSGGNVSTVAQDVPANTVDYQAELEALKNARLQSTMAGLQGKLDQAKSGIQERRAMLPAEQAELRRQASVQSKMGAKSFNEFLAQRGLARSGEAGQARLMQNMALQGELGAIGRQGQQELGQLSRQERGLQQQYATDVAQAQSGIEGDYMSQLIAARQRQQDIDRANAIRQQDIALKDRYRTEDIGIRDKYRSEDIALRDLYRSEDIALDEQRRQEERRRYQTQLNMLMEDRKLSAEDRALKLQELERNQYASDISGLGDQIDYDSEISTIQNDRDPNNDWKIPLLQQEKARQLEAMSTAKAEAQRQLRQDALDMLKATGRVSGEYSLALGGDGSNMTSLEFQKMNQSNAREWAKINKSDKDKNADMTKNELASAIFSEIKSLPVKEAVEFLKDDVNRKDIIADLGVAGYRQIWDTVLSDAISKGQAKPYNVEFKDPTVQY